jgi:hypothetical protein
MTVCAAPRGGRQEVRDDHAHVGAPGVLTPGHATASTVARERQRGAELVARSRHLASVMVCSSGQVAPLCAKVRTLPGPAETPLSGTAAAATATRVPLMATARPKAPTLRWTGR